jgi:hypothetical protein
LLCLLWRLGLASQWVIAPTVVADEALVQTSERLLVARRNDPSVPEAFLRVIGRSPLGRLTHAHVDHPAAVSATAVLILREGTQDEHRRRRQLPVFWRGFLTPCFTAAPRFWVPTAKPVWDPATWQLIAMLDAAWNADGVSFLGRERGQLFHVLGTRRMARKFGWPRRRTLAGCRTAYRVWRHWFQTREVPRLAEIDAWPLPEAVHRVIGGPRPLYRQAREAHRIGRHAENLAVLPETLRQAFDAIAAESAASLRSPVAFGWTSPPLAPLTSALVLSPLGLLAAGAGVGREDLSCAARTTAGRLIRMLTGPWPWTPRPVIRGPRRARIEARRRGNARPTHWTPRDCTGGTLLRPANMARR